MASCGRGRPGPSTRISTPIGPAAAREAVEVDARRRRAARPAATGRRRAPGSARRVRSISRTLASSTQRKPAAGYPRRPARRRRSPAPACATASPGSGRDGLDARAQHVRLEARRQRARERLRGHDEVERLGRAADLDERRDCRARRPRGAVRAQAQHVGVEELRRRRRPPAGTLSASSARPRAVRRSATGGPSPSTSGSWGRSSSSPRSSDAERRAGSRARCGARPPSARPARAPTRSAQRRSRRASPGCGRRSSASPASDDHGTQRPSPSSRSASSTMSRTTPAGLESRASGDRRSTSGSDARLVPRAAAAPGHEEVLRELLER